MNLPPLIPSRVMRKNNYLPSQVFRFAAMLIAFVMLGLCNSSFGQVAPTPPVFNPPVAILTWTDNSNNETGFIVERAEQATNPAFVILALTASNVATLTDQTPTPGKTYLYRVAAFNSVGKSAYATATPHLTPDTPTGPSNLRTLGASAITVTPATGTKAGTTPVTQAPPATAPSGTPTTRRSNGLAGSL